MTAARPHGASQSGGVHRRLGDPAATAALAARLAGLARAGDFIALRGGLGAGKTAFARAFIHARQDRAGMPREDVPSPTFTLVQLYEIPPVPVWHFDLYRIDRPDDALELGLDEALGDGIVLAEWPERLGALLPVERLDVTLDFARESEARTARLAGSAAWADRLAALAA